MPFHVHFRRPGNHAALSLFFFLLAAAAGGCGGGDGQTATHTLSGTIWAPAGVEIDGDVNDPNEDYIANDGIASAQIISNPVSLGGYVNVAGAGAPGRSQRAGDRDDFFRVDLKSADRIFLSIGDYEAGDLDLFIYEAGGGDPIAASQGDGNTESLAAPGDGTYIVNVYARSGASNYILIIGADLEAPAGILSTQHEFVPGQAIVRFADSAQTFSSRSAMSDRAADLGMDMAAGGPGRAVLLTFDPDRPQGAVSRALSFDADSLRKYTASGDLQVKLDTLQVIKALRKRSDVISAEPNYILRHFATPNDTHYNLQWHYPLINLPQAWDITTGSSQVTVAVLDTGVLLGHPDLAGKLTGGYDFIRSTRSSNDGDGIDNDPNDPGDAATPGASSFHGTHSAGTIAALTNNAAGMAGAGWNTRVMPIRVLGIGGGTLYDILQGVRFAAGMSNDSNTLPPRAADIINMSFGGGGPSSEAQALFSEVRNKGIILIAAAGNEATGIPTYPASFDGVISVSAVNIKSTRASYSNFGIHVDVAAPGGDAGDLDGDGYADRVWSTGGDDSAGQIRFNYTALNGTSMAAPHVAGVAALMKAVQPAMTSVDFQAWLEGGDLTNDIGPSGRDDEYGHGLIDAYKAVLVAENEPTRTVITAAPAALNLGMHATDALLTVSRIGADESVSAELTSQLPDWLVVVPNDIDEDGLGTYAVHVIRENLTSGTYTATIIFTASNGNSVSVPVNIRVLASSPSPTADAGFHYVLLVNADTFTLVAQNDVRAANGSYRYSFSGVEKGNYYIVAGSDRDNDRYIDDPGESLGAYPALDQIMPVTVERDLENLNFPTDLKLFLPASMPAHTRWEDQLWRALPPLKRFSVTLRQAGQIPSSRRPAGG